MAKHFCIQADIADPQSIESMMLEIMDRIDHLDVLVNNAGVYEEMEYDEMDYQSWQDAWNRTIEPNLTGVANLCSR